MSLSASEVMSHSSDKRTTLAVHSIQIPKDTQLTRHGEFVGTLDTIREGVRCDCPIGNPAHGDGLGADYAHTVLLGGGEIGVHCGGDSCGVTYIPIVSRGRDNDDIPFDDISESQADAPIELEVDIPIELEVDIKTLSKMISVTAKSYGKTEACIHLNSMGEIISFKSTSIFSMWKISNNGAGIFKQKGITHPDMAGLYQGDRKAYNSGVVRAIKDFMLNVDNYITYYRQCRKINYKVDMFAKKADFKITGNALAITYTHLPFVEEKIDETILKDLKEHFIFLDDLIRFIVAGRFATDRKQSYLWMKAISDSGKGFLFGQFKQLGAVTEVSEAQIEKLFEGSPVSLDPDEFRKSFVIWVDEFKKVKSEMKQLQNTITISPKNQLRTEVEIFTKIFTSAETVAALDASYGIEDQFANRMIYMTLEKVLPDRELFAAAGKERYGKTARGYIAREMNRLIAEYVVLGSDKASVRADKELTAAHDDYSIKLKIQTASSLRESVADDFVAYVVENNSPYSGFSIETATGRSILRSPAKAFASFVKDTYDDTEWNGIKRQRREIFHEVSTEGIRTYRNEFKAIKGLDISKKVKFDF